MIEFLLMLPFTIWLVIIIGAALYEFFLYCVDSCRKMTRERLKDLLFCWGLVYIPVIMFFVGLLMLTVKMERAAIEKANAYPYVEKEQ